ncbi:FMN-binding protein [Clostridium oryzae]|uniref:Putative electron transport protein YccM n=1 Tax=Clostridium oryzae TaxID=1450648 RepID=A0A1V4ISG3_9CLOT|nr:FMN-binding protein [Clostridium oryzae]OPJ62750.1 putative electron transport protein YccM [Clostridium oryzae]
MNKKIHKIQVFRLVVQLLFLFLFPGLFSLTFHEIGQIYKALINGSFSIKEQYANIIEAVAFIPLTILFGRFFCGWLCAFGTYNDLIYLLSSKFLKIKFKIDEETDRVLKYVKYAVLVFIVIFIWSLSIDAFSSASPWDAFAQISNIKSAAATYIIGFILLIFITIGAFFVERFFCRYLCPLGAIYSIISKLRIFNISKPKDHCGKCKMCTSNCAMGIDLYKRDKVTSGECINCMRCTEVCPRSNASASAAFTRVNSAALSAVAIAIFTGFYGLNYLLGSKLAAANIITASSNSSSTSKYKDGTYSGEGTGYMPGLQVSVKVENGKITKIDIVSDNETPRFAQTPMQVIPQEIIAAQSTDVDTVSGATRTSNGIIEAVNDALSQASK